MDELSVQRMIDHIFKVCEGNEEGITFDGWSAQCDKDSGLYTIWK